MDPLVCLYGRPNQVVHASNDSHCALTLLLRKTKSSVNAIGLGDVDFIPGELLLKAFSSLDSEYKADAVILMHELEVMLLETSGPHDLADRPQFGFDHINGIFGSLTMFRATIEKYPYAELCVVPKLKL
ncbi:hypothetical protein BCR43DRAFT_503721 [Syncephalastrum racemosum]|uniref:Uncharacterized protein n=1 Tax=Syncephalastrum racemosum TaxID=13706 RepID=A0A1X2HIP2_SYNRA|nr:hypothetical protein BCR43DRAFT_503721 [Syncephalastrum racemosum]